MRLLNVNTKRVESYPNRLNSDIPDYAILSHRWGEEEVTFEEMEKKSHEDIRSKKGYEKIQRCCEIAADTGFEFIWIDTCCIDKRNDLELTNTLAAMFQYYRDAQVCYTYLYDVENCDNPYDAGSSFRGSSWFSRGWTLQELVAPLYVTFFDRHWREIGTKSSLQKIITEETGIPPHVLLMNHPGDISVAKRRRWATYRQTSKPEDRVYCLMGLLGVRMPVRYGEGQAEAAAARLDEEIALASSEAEAGRGQGNPSSFDVGSWMRPEPEYTFFVRVPQRPDRATRVVDPEIGPHQWTVGVRETRLWFDRSGDCATLLFKDTGGQVFAACLGVHNYNVWCGLTADCADESIRDVAWAYWNGDKKGARWDNMDRRMIQLPSSGDIVELAIRKGRQDGKRAYFVDVAAGENFWLDKVGPGVYPGWWTG